MASTAQEQIQDFTKDNLAIKTLREILWASILLYGPIGRIARMVFGARNGQKIDIIKEFDTIGEAMATCNPEWNTTTLFGTEKEWELGILAVREILCADDFEDTVAAYSLSHGLNRGDLTGGDLVNILIEPALRTALEKAYWRIYLLGDTTGQHISDGGQITNSVPLKFMTIADGFFKRMFEQAPTGSAQHVPIAANSEATYQAAYAAMAQTGVATGIIDEMIARAGMQMPEVTGRADAMIVCTGVFGDILLKDIQRNNIGSNYQWESIFTGFVDELNYQGIRFVRLKALDELIRKFNMNETTGMPVLPFRAYLSFHDNYLAGSAIRETELTNLRVFYDEGDEVTKISYRDEIGTQIVEEDKFIIAY